MDYIHVIFWKYTFLNINGRVSRKSFPTVWKVNQEFIITYRMKNKRGGEIINLLQMEVLLHWQVSGIYKIPNYKNLYDFSISNL